MAQSWAVAEAKAGDFVAARCLFERVTAVQPESAPSWHAWATMELSAGDPGRARTLYCRALELKPDSVATMSALGHLERRRVARGPQGLGCRACGVGFKT